MITIIILNNLFIIKTHFKKKFQNKKDRKSGQAEDCDDLLRERAPYTIHIVLKNDLESCGVCNWNELCHGCDVRNLKNFCNLLPTQTLVVHWEPISLHFHFKEALIERRTNQEPGKGDETKMIFNTYQDVNF